MSRFTLNRCGRGLAAGRRVAGTSAHSMRALCGMIWHEALCTCVLLVHVYSGTSVIRTLPFHHKCPDYRGFHFKEVRLRAHAHLYYSAR